MLCFFLSEEKSVRGPGHWSAGQCLEGLQLLPVCVRPDRKWQVILHGWLRQQQGHRSLGVWGTLQGYRRKAKAGWKGWGLSGMSHLQLLFVVVHVIVLFFMWGGGGVFLICCCCFQILCLFYLLLKKDKVHNQKYILKKGGVGVGGLCGWSKQRVKKKQAINPLWTGNALYLLSFSLFRCCCISELFCCCLWGSGSSEIKVLDWETYKFIGCIYVYIL